MKILHRVFKGCTRPTHGYWATKDGFCGAYVGAYVYQTRTAIVQKMLMTEIVFIKTGLFVIMFLVSWGLSERYFVRTFAETFSFPLKILSTNSQAFFNLLWFVNLFFVKTTGIPNVTNSSWVLICLTRDLFSLYCLSHFSHW